MTRILLANALLRPWTWHDADSLVRHANNRNVSRYLRDIFPYPYTESAAQAWLEHVVDRLPIMNFAIEVEGEAAGSVGLRRKDDMYRHTAELGYWLSETYWGRGIITEAAKAMVRYGFTEFDFVRIEADVIGQKYGVNHGTRKSRPIAGRAAAQGRTQGWAIFRYSALRGP